VPFDYSKAWVGVDFHGVSSAAGIGGVSEGNAMYNATNAFYVDTGTTRSAIQRDNYFSNVLYGMFHNFGSGGSAEQPLRAADDQPAHPITHTGTLATFTAKYPHRLRAGMVVRISGARINNAPAPIDTYNVEAVVESVSNPNDPNDRSFSYRMKQDPGANADKPTTAFPVLFGALWQTTHYLMENNLIDCYVTDAGSPFAARAAVLYGYEGGPPYVFPQWVVRENIVRPTDDLTSSPGMQGHTSAGFQADSVGYGTIQENVIDVLDPNPIHRFFVGTVKCFNNRTAAGGLLRGYNQLNPVNRDSELEDSVALILSL
jgi:hypothetical protein